MAATLAGSPKLTACTMAEDAGSSDVDADAQEVSENRTVGSAIGREEGSEIYHFEDDLSEHGNFEHEGSQSDASTFSDKYAKGHSSLCSYCESFLLQVLKNNKKSDSYRFPEHYESFWHMKKSSETCGLCWSLIDGTEEYLHCFPLQYPQDRYMELGCYGIYSATYKKPFCNESAIANAGIHEFTLRIGSCGDDPRFRFLLMAEDGSGIYNSKAADQAEADWTYRFCSSTCHLV